ncbi:copper chaperone PCu(A)C [Octadecabacter sp.]|nr:copper chaperone PCu(A)C [Octadecabacter sp.]
MSLKSTFLGAIVALGLATPVLAEIEIHDQYARSSNAMTGAAFMVIHNYSDIDDRLIGVTSNAAARTEIHTHIEDDNGVMRMVHVEDGIGIPAGGEILMKRGANHVMFMGLSEPFVQDADVIITLMFETAGAVEVIVPVDQDRVETDHGAMDHSDMDHSDH